jgi:hypothetical protein
MHFGNVSKDKPRVAECERDAQMLELLEVDLDVAN